MRTTHGRGFRPLVLLAAILASALAAEVGAGPSSASAQAAPSDRQALKGQLQEATGGRGRVVEHPGTGLVRFFGTESDHPVVRGGTVPAGGSPEVAARRFLGTYGPLFGADDQGRDLRLKRTAEADRGRSTVRFQQLHRGVPVFGGELVVNLDGDREVLSASGELSPAPSIDVKPAIAAADAAAQALTAMAKQHGVDPALLRAAEPALWVYDPVLLGEPGRPGTRLVWRTEVTSVGGDVLRELVLVDAGTGSIVLNFDQLGHARNRRICDRNNVVASETCVAPYTRSEGGAATGIADVDTVYTYAGNVYDFFFDHFGRDSLNRAGMPLTSTVRFCETASECPLNNAFWNGSQTTFGQGFISDDIVGHEFAHGLTEFESNLFYRYQSGAINESMSDVFGELIDLTNGLGNDGPAVRWLQGEDVPGGAVRNMANPPDFGHPDSMTSPNYRTGTDDSGGIHSNSGVNNKAAFLMTDGGTFNGITVSGLGTTKVAHIYYETNTNLLTSAGDYQDLFHALKQACLNKVGVVGITTANCTEVEKAAAATRMDQPAPGGGAREAPVCPVGAAVNTLFFDDMENTGSGNWTFGGSGGGGWIFEVGYATSGLRSMYASNPPTVSDRTSARSAAVVPPGGQTTYLRFNHSFETEADFDGGIVEHSTNGGSTWADSGPLFTDNGYNRTNSSGPLAGRQVFGDRSMGYGSSRLDLSSLAGQSVRFRFRFASDDTVSALGWDIDDVRVYTCGPAGPDFTPLTPARILDTRTSVGGHAGKLVGGETANVVVTGVGGVPASGVDSVVLNVTATGGSASTFLTVFPAGESRPVASNLNVVAGQDVPNLVVAKVGANGSVAVYNLQGSIDVIFDVVGWYRPAPSCFTSLTPARILDTRSTTKVGAGESRDVKVTGVGGVPSTGVGAVVMNVTATQATASTFLTVFPAGQPRPDASNLNVVPNQDVPNLVVAKVGANGNVSVFNLQGTIDVIFDVVGWHPSAAACFTSLTPARILDSRSTTPVGAGQARDVKVTGTGGVPATGVSAVVLNVTATQATASTFLTVFPAGQPRPNASNLNVVPNQNIPNLVVAKVGTDGNVTVFNFQGSTHVIFDVVGYYPG